MKTSTSDGRGASAFTVGDQSSSPKLGLIGPDRTFGMFANGRGKRLIALAGGEAGTDVLAREPETAARMEALCRALFETARYLPYANTPATVRAAAR